MSQSIRGEGDVECEPVPPRMASFVEMRTDTERVTKVKATLVDESRRYPLGQALVGIVCLGQDEYVVTVNGDAENSAYFCESGAGLVAVRAVEEWVGDRDGEVVLSLTVAELSPDSVRVHFEGSRVVRSII